MIKRKMRPVHPGTILLGMIRELREETGESYTIKEIALGLGITTKTLSTIINQKAGISPEMAVKLSEAFDTDAMLWLNLQRQYDLWLAEKVVNRETIRHFIIQNPSSLQAI
jgi:antitoxin HigA-1